MKREVPKTAVVEVDVVLSVVLSSSEVVVVLSVVLSSSEVVVSSLVVDAPSSLLLAQEMMVRLKRKRERIMSRCLIVHSQIECPSTSPRL